VLLGLLERLELISDLGFAEWPPLGNVHPAARRLMAGWGYRYDAWSLRRFQPPKRYAVLLCFLQAALAETADAVVEAQDKLITSIHSKAKKRRDALHQLRHTHATELVNTGVSLATIRKRLGHRNLQTTLSYAEQSDAVADAELRAWRRRGNQGH
jgi:integrase